MKFDLSKQCYNDNNNEILIFVTYLSCLLCVLRGALVEVRAGTDALCHVGCSLCVTWDPGVLLPSEPSDWPGTLVFIEEFHVSHVRHT